LFEVSEALASFEAAKAQIDEMKRKLDALWAEYEKMQKDLSRKTPSTPTTPVRQPVAEPPRPAPPPQKVPSTRSVRVYDIFRHRLRERVIKVSTDQRKSLYSPISFTSLTDVDAFTTVVPSHQYDCATVMRSGIAGFRQLYKFGGSDAFAERREHKQLTDLLGTQVKSVRFICAMKAVGEAAGRPQKPAARPDGDEVTVHFSWVVGNLSESISATCQNRDSGNWVCSADGDFASLRTATESDEAPDYQIVVELKRWSGGQESTSTFAFELVTPDSANPVPSVFKEGSVPEGTCDPGRYPSSSVLAYILQHYGAGCQ
jgi:hypothetical protein